MNDKLGIGVPSVRVDADNLLADKEIIERVQKVWAVVFEASGKVLQHANTFGFNGMGVIPDPNIHKMLTSLRMLSALMEVLSNDKYVELSYEERRLILNSKEQLNRMERVAAALDANDRAGFDEAIRCLEKQAAF